MKFLARFVLCFVLSFTLVEFPVMHAYAGVPQMGGPITTTEAMNLMGRAEQQARVAQIISRADVQAELSRLGVSPAEAERRLAALSDAEVNDLSHDIDNATLGGDIGGILVVVLLVVLIIYLVKRI